MGRPAKNLIGQKFAKLEVISQAQTKNKNARWLCKCDCGNEKEVEGVKLTKGITRSCGCAKLQLYTESMTRHGMSNTRVHNIWLKMRQRCYSPNYVDYPRYGARGIKICEDWEVFENFAKWAEENGYSEHLTLDRKNNDGMYGPDNCKWSTTTEQSNNRRSNKHLTIDGETKTIAEWSRHSGVKYETIRSRIKSGITGKELISH